MAGVLGLAFLLQTLHRLSVINNQRDRDSEPEVSAPETQPADAEQTQAEIVDAEAVGAPPGPSGPLDQLEGHVLGRHVKVVFRCWIVVFGLVGAQMGWVLRPFIGNPNQEFTWFRDRDSSFFEAVLHSLGELLIG